MGNDTKPVVECVPRERNAQSFVHVVFLVIIKAQKPSTKSVNVFAVNSTQQEHLHSDTMNMRHDQQYRTR